MTTYTMRQLGGAALTALAYGADLAGGAHGASTSAGAERHGL